VVRQPLDLIGEAVGRELFDGLDNARVQRPTALLQEAPVGYLVGQGVVDRNFKRPFALPVLSAGALRIIAAITHSEVMRKILQHLKLSADPPPIAPAHVRQAAFAWSSA
jgi:hypothetical protein